MNNEEMKNEFLKWFGKELWDEQEILNDLDQISINICKNYLGLEPIPVIFENLSGVIAIFDYKLMCIKLNRKYKDDFVVLAASVAHELEHYYQLAYVSSMDTPKARRWGLELLNYKDEKNPELNEIQEIEIDAEAFAEVVLETEYGIIYRNPDEKIQELINEYITSKKILEP